jgi:hypothetical protein
MLGQLIELQIATQGSAVLDSLRRVWRVLFASPGPRDRGRGSFLLIGFHLLDSEMNEMMMK